MPNIKKTPVVGHVHADGDPSSDDSGEIERTELLFDAPQSGHDPDDRTEVLSNVLPPRSSDSRHDSDDDRTLILTLSSPHSGGSSHVDVADLPPPSCSPGWFATDSSATALGPPGHIIRIPQTGGVSAAPTPSPSGSWAFTSPVSPGAMPGIIYNANSGAVSANNNANTTQSSSTSTFAQNSGSVNNSAHSTQSSSSPTTVTSDSGSSNNSTNSTQSTSPPTSTVARPTGPKKAYVRVAAITASTDVDRGPSHSADKRRAELLAKFDAEVVAADGHLHDAEQATSEQQRLGALQAAHQRLVAAGDTSQRPPRTDSLGDEVGQAMDRARGDLALADTALKKVPPDLVAATGALGRARTSLADASTYRESLVDPDDPRAVVHFIDLRIGAAERDAHLNGLQHGAETRGDSVDQVFIAPEWFFRRPRDSAGSRPYTDAEFATITQDIGELSKKYGKWVIMPGTIYHGDASAEHGGRFLIKNDGLIAHEGRVEVIPKKFEADALSNDEVWAESRSTNSRFTANDLTYAVDICRDFRMGTASVASPELVDVHMITSNSVKFSEGSIIARDGGLVIWNDGHAGGMTKVYRVKWTKDPKSTEIHYARVQVARDFEAAAKLDVDMANGQSERFRLQATRHQLKAKLSTKLSRAEKTATTVALQKCEVAIASNAKDQERLDHLYKIVTLRRTELAQYIKFDLIHESKNKPAPDQLFELEPDRYRK